jgi:hypothetical protein
VIDLCYWPTPNGHKITGLGPMAGQNHHFNRYAPEKIPYAIERYVKETNRLYGVLYRRLVTAPYLAGEDYSAADLAVYPYSCRISQPVRSHDRKSPATDGFSTGSGRCLDQRRSSLITAPVTGLRMKRSRCRSSSNMLSNDPVTTSKDCF